MVLDNLILYYMQIILVQFIIQQLTV